MLPKAEMGSVSSARAYAAASVGPTATPQGLECLMITAAGSENSRTSARAASRSSRLLKDRSLPCNTSAAARVPAVSPGSW